MASRRVWSSPRLRCAARRSWRTWAEAGAGGLAFDGGVEGFSAEGAEEGAESEAVRSARWVSGGVVRMDREREGREGRAQNWKSGGNKSVRLRTGIVNGLGGLLLAISRTKGGEVFVPP